MALFEEECMTRRIAGTRDRRFLIAALALAPLALAACGGKDSSSRTTSDAGGTPTIINASTTTSSSEGISSPAAPTASATFEDAEAAYQAGNYVEARRLFESYITTRPENPWGHYMLGLAAWKSGDLESAEGSFNRAIALDSAHVKSYINGARVLLDLGRNHEALERGQQALALDPSSTDGLRVVARAYHSMGRADSAIEAYRNALLADDRDVWSLNNLGVLYLDKGEPELALAPLARAVQLRSTAPVFQNNLGLALERTGHIAAAQLAFQAALQADSTYSKAVVSLARVSALVADSTDIVDLDELAQVFRMQLGIWRDNAFRPDESGVVDTVSSPDSVEGVKQDDIR
jgi:tetratricopeptide (TPR) repeat protein